MKVIQKFLKNPLRNFNYIIISDTSSDSIFFDPFDIDQTLPLLGKHKPKYLLNTHHHPDHIRHNKEFLQLPGVTKLELSDGEVFHLSETEKIKAVYTPGHVDDHICYFLFDSDKLSGIITGDTVFNAGVGNCKNGGNPDQLFETIRDIFQPIHEAVPIYPSHDYLLSNLKFAATVEPENADVKDLIERRSKMNLDEEFINTTLADEQRLNPFFRVFHGVFDNADMGENRREIFKNIRLKRDKW